MKTASKFIFGLIIVLSAVSCSDNVVFEDSARVALPTWNADSVVNFNVNIENTDKVYQTSLLIRNSGNYEYQNLWLFITETAPDSTVKRDTVQMFLADDYGQWFGSGIGSLYTNLVLYKDSVKFDKKGVYRYEIAHGMRVDELAGLNDIGLKVVEED